MGEIFEASKGDEANYKASAEKRYFLIFRENRTFELKVGRTIYLFGPHQSVEIPETVLNHPDFLQQKKFFIIGTI